MPDEFQGKPSQEVLEILVAHGWDINTGDDWPLLWSVVQWPDLIRWCLDHGAQVDVPDTPPTVNGNVESRSGVPHGTILSMAASFGSVETFELLRAKGAPLDPSPLHCAVEKATQTAPKGGCEPGPFYMNMIRHLVDVVKLDVNAVQHKLGRSCNTPLCIAAGRPTDQNFRELISFLLDRGADPYLNCKSTPEDPGWPTAIDCAQSWGNMQFLEAVENQQAEK